MESRGWVRRSASVVVLLSSGLVGCSGKETVTGVTRPTNEGRDAGDSASEGATSEDSTRDDGGGGTSAPQNGSEPVTPAPTAGESTATSTEGDTDTDAPVIPPGSANKLDLLLVVDNSANMPEKAAVFADSVRYLLEQLVQPPCIDEDGEITAPSGEDCPAGSAPLHAPLNDIHVGVITTSLGAYGAENTCVVDPNRPDTFENDDGAHLAGSLQHGLNLPGGDFLIRQPNSDQSLAEFLTDIDTHLVSAGEHGCGYEAPLEAWTRFLVDPAPYTRIVRTPCNSSDTANSCNGPELGANGQPLIDSIVLSQRAAFLRPDSLVGIVVLTDENDCSMKSKGQTWIVTDQEDSSGTFRGSAACEADPNDPCCQSCGSSRVPAGCPTEADGTAPGCAELTFPVWTRSDPGEDSPNLRCFQQKRRFGVDFLFPTERYVNALTQDRICPADNTLYFADSFCNVGEQADNPLWVNGGIHRPPGRVLFTTISGVPWQDLAVDPDAEVVTYRGTAGDAEPSLDWDLLLGLTSSDGTRPLYATADGALDPLLVESVTPRSGSNWPTDTPLAAPDSPYMANPINGHEWNIVDRSALQYSCLMPMPEPEVCLSADDQAALAAEFGVIHSCHCSDYGNDEFRSPTCQAPDGSYGLTKYFSGAFPPTRLLQVQERLVSDGPVTSIVGSVCAKSLDDSLADSGFKPTMDLLLAGLRSQLE